MIDEMNHAVQVKCHECGEWRNMEGADFKYNHDRLQEQKEFRQPGEKFKFNYRATCPVHGFIYEEKTIRLKGNPV